MLTRPCLTALSLFAFAALGVAWAPRTGNAQSACTLRKGLTAGDWNLPSGPGSSDGFIDGKLYLGSSTTVLYDFTAVLDEVPSPCLSCREGELHGYLDDGIGPAPDYVVHGTWFGSFFSGEGSWKAQIYDANSPTVTPVGRMKGTFSDPPSSPDPVGTYHGRWGICD